MVKRRTVSSNTKQEQAYETQKNTYRTPRRRDCPQTCRSSWSWPWSWLTRPCQASTRKRCAVLRGELQPRRLRGRKRNRSGRSSSARGGRGGRVTRAGPSGSSAAPAVVSGTSVRGTAVPCARRACARAPPGSASTIIAHAVLLIYSLSILGNGILERAEWNSISIVKQF